MTDSPVAIGRDVGKVDTDAGGLARYSMKLQVPSGISPDTEPEISLEYCQGTPNGSLGVGWALGGISCIRRAPSSLAYDGINPPPPGYDSSKSKLTLDGTELFNIQGDYDSPNAQYTVEIDSDAKIVSPQGQGFVARDSSGRRWEYGTSEESRVWVSGQKTIREWRLTRMLDYHGNAVTYSYVASPRGAGSAELNTCYISGIRYTSNEKTGFLGNRIVRFDYESRPDSVIQTVQGDKCVWASRLAAIRFGFLQGSETQITRSYELGYSTSEYSGDSCLTSITETAVEGSKKTSLMPSTFGYTQQGVPTQDLFKNTPTQAIPLRSTTDNVALFTMNVSGRCLADLVCVRYNKPTNKMSIKTYLAERKSDGTLGWQPSDGPGGEATMPPMELKGGFPSILSPDFDNDGRSDFVVPFATRDGMLRFSISQCIGTGYKPATVKNTDFKYTEGSKFMTLDIPGGGVSIVQIFTSTSNKLAFRSFLSVSEKGDVGLKDAVTSNTTYSNEGTIDWFQIMHAGTGQRSLVRVWAEGIGQGRKKIQATTFAMRATGSFEERMTSVLLTSAGSSSLKYLVLPCDINADGTQDLVLATAEYLGSKMTLNYFTFLGNGEGAFSKHGDVTERRSESPAPMNSPEYGQFYITNFNGNNYPTLSYVFQEKHSKAYRCVSVDGRSDASISEAKSYSLTNGELPIRQAQVMATDLNGNAVGDWLFYTLENDNPRVLPVYNPSSTVDFMSWAQNPMGLRTTLTYGCLSDETVYTSGIDWRHYSNNDATSYPVLAAPNYVVTSLTHRNESSINSIDFNVVIKKTYGKARISRRGRGWLGFGEINSLNVRDGNLTTEKYLQSWPLAGIKYQVETKKSNGETLKSEITTYKDFVRKEGPWNIYRIERMEERSDMLDGSNVARSNKTQYEYDRYGNMTLQARLEIHQGQVVFESWKRCSYTTIDGVTNVLTNQKFSANENNKDMSLFEAGDVSLTINESEKDRAVLKGVLTWSSDVNQFTRKSYVYDVYGRQVETVDAAGLKRVTSYDSVFQAHRVKVVEEGSGVKTTELLAYDLASGNEVAKWEPNGDLTCHNMDGFGRIIDSRSKAIDSGPSTVKAIDFLNEHVADSGLTALLGSTYICPRKTISFGRESSPQGKPYLFVKAILYSKDGVDGRHEVVEYLDCVKQSCRKSSQDGDDTDKSWIYTEYDTRGNSIYESFPVRLPALTGLDWIPDPLSGARSTYDVLGRPIMRIRPSHGQKDRFIVVATTHLDGGAKVQEVTMESTDPTSPLSGPSRLAQLERRYIQIVTEDGKEDLVVENTDENGLRSTYKYNVLAKLVGSTDPAGQVELRAYNSTGDLTRIENVYQGALSYEYDATRQLISETNAVGEVIRYQRDAKGRALEKIGYDGRAVKYGYEASTGNLTSIAIYPTKEAKAFESRFDYAYDVCGRITERSLILSDQSSFKTTFSYDWQDQVVRKVQPDNVVVTHDYRGSTMRSSSLSDSSASTWKFKAENEQFSPYGRPMRLRLQGSGMKEDFVHLWEYDSQGFPVTHSLDTGSASLAKEHYTYNSMDQIQRKHEFSSGITTDYQYSGKRLVSSQSGTKKMNTYTYDASGNLTNKQGTAISQTRTLVKGDVNGASVFDVSLDDAGRMIRRTTNELDLTFSYDSLGALQSWKDTTKSRSADFLADHDGETFQRKYSDGSSELFLSQDLSINITADGRRVVRHHLIHKNSLMESDNAGYVVGTITNVFDTTETKRPLAGQRKLKIQFSDTKGTVVQVFNGEDGSSSEKIEYDDFGMLDQDSSRKLNDQAANHTYENNYLDILSGLLNFGGRWYDPLTGRFTTPDNILDIGSLLRTDGLNRFAFENNDPVNNVDPTGHWSWSAILGVVVSTLLVAAAIGLTIITGGAAAPLAAAVVGALVAGGVAGIIYSVEHQDEQDAGKFWGGWGTTVALNAAIGAVTGGLGAAVAGPAQVASAVARIAIKAVIAGGAAVLAKAAERGVDNMFYGKHHDLFKDWDKTFLTGAVVGGAFGAFSSGSSGGSGWKAALKHGGKATLKPGGKLAGWGVKEIGVKNIWSAYTQYVTSMKLV